MSRYGGGMPTVRNHPARPLAAQAGMGLLGTLLLLVLLGVTVGLGAAGAVIGVGYALVLTTTLVRAVARSGRYRLGPADAVTLTRAVLIGGLTALIADSFRDAAQAQAALPVMVALASIALALDAVDGIQGVVLAVAMTDVLPTPVMTLAVLAALALLAESFARQIRWLYREHRR